MFSDWEDLALRIDSAIKNLESMIVHCESMKEDLEVIRLKGKVEGLKLTSDYMRSYEQNLPGTTLGHLCNHAVTDG